MWWFKLVNAQGSYASLTQLVKRSATYCPQANYHHIKTSCFHGAILLQKIKERKGDGVENGNLI
jgi:hypothetical protein